MNKDIKSFLGKRNLFVLFFAIFVCALNSCGGSGGGGNDSGGTTPTYITWSKTYGESDEDAAYSVQQATDGGYIVAGNSNNEILVIKVDAYGNTVWQYTQAGIANSIINSGDGGYLVAGQFYSPGIPLGYAGIIKLNSDGKLQGQQTYGNYGSIANGIKQTSDGGYIIVGEENKDIIVLKIKSNGNLDWPKYYGGSGEDRGYSIQEVSDGFVIAGETVLSGRIDSDIWIFKIDSSGTKIWELTFGGNSYDTAFSIRLTSDGGFIAAGKKSSSAGDADFWIARLKSNGDLEWEKTYGSTYDEIAYSIQQTSDGGYIVAGETSSYGAGGSDIWILKLDTNGNKIWDKTYGSSGNDVARSIQQTSDGGYIVAGETTTDAGDTDFWVLKLDANGNLN